MYCTLWVYLKATVTSYIFNVIFFIQKYNEVIKYYTLHKIYVIQSSLGV